MPQPVLFKLLEKPVPIKGFAPLVPNAPARSTPAFPIAASDLAFFFDADQIPPQTDNTNLASWPDSVANISMVDALSNGFSSLSNNTKYRTSRTNGRPAVQFLGGAGMELGRPTALINALNRYNTSTGVTLFFVMANVGGPTLNFASNYTSQFFGTETVGSGKLLAINNDGSGGQACGPYAYARFTAPTTGLQVIVVRCDTVSTNNGFGHFFHNGNATDGWDATPHATENYLVGSANGAAAGGNNTLQPYYSSVCDMMAFGCYNRSLTYAEIIKLTAAAFDKYGSAYPWAGASNFLVFDGDSIELGTGTTTTDSPPRNITDLCWPNILATLKSRPFGTWSNLGVSARTSDQMTAAAAVNYQGLSAALGMPVHVFNEEYYNQPDADAHGTLNFNAALKAIDPTIKIATLDGVATGDKETNRAAYNTAVGSDANTDVKVPISTDPSVGVSWSGTYFADNAHPNDAGHGKVRDFVSPYYDTLNVIEIPRGAAAGTGAATGVGAALAASTGAAAGTGSASAVGRSLGSGVGSAAGVGSASAAAIITSAGSASGTGAATAVGLSQASAAGAASGTGAASAVPIVSGSASGAGSATAIGSALGIGVGSSAGTGSATGVGSSTAVSVGSSAGTGSATAVGRSLANASGSSSGTGAASAVGAPLAIGVGSASGTGSATGVSAGVNTGSAAGIGSAAAVGASLASSAGSAAGTGAASAVGAAQALAAGASAGIGAATAVGASKAAAAGAAAGTGAGSAIGVALDGATGAAAGSGSASAVGASIASAAGSAAGTGSATGVPVSTVPVGNASGTGSASAIGKALASAQGASAGLGAATGVGTASAIATGAAAGSGAANTNGTGLFTATGTASGSSTATATGKAFSTGVGLSAGFGVAVGPGQSIARAIGLAAAVGTASGAGSFTEAFPPVDTPASRRTGRAHSARGAQGSVASRNETSAEALRKATGALPASRTIVPNLQPRKGAR